MTLLFVDGFDHYASADILKKWSSTVNSPTIGASSGRRSGGGMIGATNANASKVIATTSVAVFVGMAYQPTSSAGSNRNIIQLQDSAVVHLAVQRDLTTGVLSVLRGTTVLATGATPIVVGTTYYIEFSGVVHDSTGAYTLRINNAIELTATNVDTRNAGNASVNTVTVGSSGASGAAYIIDDLYICDANGSTNNNFLGDVRIDTLYPTSDGNYSQFTPSTGSDHYALVDETAPNTTDYNDGTTVGHRDSYGLGNLAALTSQTVYGVQVNAAILKDDAGAKSASTMVRSGSTDSDGASAALGTSQVYVSQIYEQDPAAAAAWTETTVNAMEAGVKVTA